MEDKPENYFTMSYSLTHDGENTLLTFKQSASRPGTSSNSEENTGDEEDEQSVLFVHKRLAESAS